MQIKALMDGRIFEDPKRLKAFIYFLDQANHEPYTTMVAGRPVAVERGQFIFGRKIHSRKLGMHESSMYRILDYFCQEKMVKIDNLIRCTLISIMNFDTYMTEHYEEKKSNTSFDPELFDIPAIFSGDTVGAEQISSSEPNTYISLYKERLYKDNITKSNITCTPEISSKQGGNPPVSSKPESPHEEPHVAPVATAKSDHALLVRFWCEKFLEKFGRKYYFVYGKDNAIIKRLLKYDKAERIAEMMNLYFNDEDPFLARIGYTLGMFEKKANLYSIELARNGGF